MENYNGSTIFVENDDNGIFLILPLQKILQYTLITSKIPKLPKVFIIAIWGKVIRFSVCLCVLFFFFREII